MTDRLSLEMKAALSVDEAGTISGIAWPFGSPDRVGDVITAGAFKAAKAPLPMLAYHDPSAPVGVWSDVRETAQGLEVKGRLLVEDLALARELRALVSAGAVGGLSIGFRTLQSEPRRPSGRTIKKVDLLEISLVSVPAHPGARVTSAKSAMTALRLAEAIDRAVARIRSTK